MSTRIRLAAAAIALAVAGSPALAQGPTFRAGAGEAGRYQLVRVSETRLFLIDTATGQCWSRTPDGDWRDEGNPAQTLAPKPARQAKGPAPTLTLPEKSVEMVVIQREERAIPGSDGSVRIRLGDITGGQALLSVVTAEDDPLLERISVAQGDRVEFAVGKKRYAVHVKELRNLLIGDDFAKLTVAEAPVEGSREKQRPPDREK